MELTNKTMVQLVDIYNSMNKGKDIKKFVTKEVGIKRITGMIKSNPRKKAAESLIQSKGDLDNIEFAKLGKFKAFCAVVKIETTKRQASKFRMRRGLAYQGS